MVRNTPVFMTSPGYFFWALLSVVNNSLVLFLMSDVLDYIVSTAWAFYTVLAILCILPSVFIIKRPFKNLVLGRITQFLTVLLAFSAIMYLTLGPNSYAVEFIGGLSNGQELCLIEKHISSDGDGMTYDEYRLYVINLENGEKLSRMNIDSPELLCVKENSVIFFERISAVEYDLKSGEKIYEWSNEKGFEKFPELSSGIYDLNRQSSLASNYINKGFLNITAKNGRKYYFDLLHDSLYEGNYYNNIITDGYSFSEYGVQYKMNSYTVSNYYFVSEVDEIKKLKYEGNYDKDVRFYEGTFLSPSVIALNEKESFFVVKHFETLDKKTAIYTAVNFDFTTRWNINQKDLAIKDKYPETPLPGISFAVEDKLILTFGGAVLCLNSLTGDIRWQNAY